MYYYSGLGTPTDYSPRTPLKRFCRFDVFFVNILRIAVFSLGVKQATLVETYCECVLGENIDTFEKALKLCHPGSAYVIVFVTLFVSHCVDVFVAGVSVVYFTCFHDRLTRKVDLKLLSSERKCSMITRCFIGFAGIFTCGILGGDEAVRGDYANFSLLMANYLKGDGTLDITLSDVYVGLYMFALLQKRKKLSTKNRLKKEHYRISVRQISIDSHKSGSSRSGNNSKCDTIGEESMIPEVSSNGQEVEFVRKKHSLTKIGDEKLEMLSRFHPEEVNLINEASRMMVYAHAAYSVAGYIMSYPLTGYPRIVCHALRKFMCFSPPEEYAEEDNRCHHHTIAFKEISGLADEDIVFATFSDTLSTIPYMIVLDHEWKSIVITIRGTISLESAITDMNIAPEELTTIGKECGFDGEGLYCHTGMLATTTWVYRDIEKRGHLKRLAETYSDYRLRITGHSLGAGVASILSVLFRPKYPDLRCISFSPPGCVMSENLADETTSFTTSYVINDDIIIRMNLESFEELRNGVLEMICRIKVPKYQVTKVIKKYDDSTLEGLSQVIDEILYDKDDVKDSRFKQQVDKFLKFQDQLKEKHKQHYIKLCPPGHIIQMFDTRDVVSESGEMIGRHVARWAARSDFSAIEISPQFITDHETAGVTEKIHALATESFGLSAPFLPLSNNKAQA